MTSNPTWPNEEPCERCDDSGYAETIKGGFWTGEGLVSSMTICDCPCGDDVRRERAARVRKEPNHD